MPPRPYSDRSVPKRDSSNSSASAAESYGTQTNQDNSHDSHSTATSPSLADEPLPFDSTSSGPTVTEEAFDDCGGLSHFYPTPADSMPFDHAFPDFIRQITHQRDLSNVHSLRLRVVSRLVSLQRMSLFTTNLRELDLEGSILSSLRDIGCNLKFLQILRVTNCQLDSLDGTFGLTSLKELYAEKNKITDVSPCSNLPHIRHIDASHNCIRDISYAGFLSVCPKLKSIVFTGNPATHFPDYRDHVKRILPQIQSLDNLPITRDDVEEDTAADGYYEFGEDYTLNADSTELDNLKYECETDSLDVLSGSGSKSRNLSFVSAKTDSTDVRGELLPNPVTRNSQGMESNLLSLRKERDGSGFKDNRSVNINIEETSDLAEHRLMPNPRQTSEDNDSFTLPPLLSITEESRKMSRVEDEPYLGTGEPSKPVAQMCSLENKLTVSRCQSPDSVSDSRSVNVDTPSPLIKGKQRARPQTAAFSSPSVTNNVSVTADYGRNGDGITEPCTMPSSSNSPEVSIEDVGGQNMAHKRLTSGMPVCGNLAVALRNRRKRQEKEDGKSFFQLIASTSLE